MGMLGNVGEYLKGLHFPASKDQIVKFAQDHHAPDMILQALEKIPDKQYENAENATAEAAKKIM